MSDKQPRLGVALLVQYEGSLLLGRRARGGNVGQWVIPGGGVELGESWVSAGEREIFEETGVRVVANRRVEYVMEIIGPSSHRVCLVAHARLVSSQWQKASAELSDVRFVPIGEIDALELSAPVRECLWTLGFRVMREADSRGEKSGGTR